MLKGKVAWNKQIRPDAIAKASNSCELCGSKASRLICHDKWKYDDKTRTANLIGFEVHCGNCDMVTHYKRMMQVRDPEEVLQAVVAHLCAVNKCEIKEALNILIDAHNVWEKRNVKKWKVAVTPKLLKQYPELAGLPKFSPPAIEY